MAKSQTKDSIIGGTMKSYNHCPFVDITLPLSPYIPNIYLCNKAERTPCPYVDNMESCEIREKEIQKRTNKRKEEESEIEQHLKKGDIIFHPYLPK